MSAARRAASTDIVPINAALAKKPRRARAPVVSVVPSGELPEDPIEAASHAETTAHEALAEDSVFSTGKITKAPATRPPEAPKTDLLQSGSGVDCDEAYGDEEKLLSEFVRLHPVLSLEATSQKTLQLLADLTEKHPIPTRELEIVPKSHDDEFLRPPRTDVDERPCCLGNRCLCVWMARWRYGAESELAFVCREFLTPLQQAAFVQSGKLPTNVGKCLVCTRYVSSYIYRIARADPTFRPSAHVPLQAFGNQLGTECASANTPHAASVAQDADGYRREALLYADEAWANSSASRSGGMASFLWRPVVKFSSAHYEYVRDDGGPPRMIQVGVGAEDDRLEHRAAFPHFRPPAEQKAPSAPSAKQPCGCAKSEEATDSGMLSVAPSATAALRRTPAKPVMVRRPVDSAVGARAAGTAPPPPAAAAASTRAN